MIIPLFLYEDDFECGNPLGSHKTIYKMSGMYVSIPCLPPEIRSKVQNIFLFQIAHSEDGKKYPSEIFYKDVIEQLNNLATQGITINISGKFIKIYFKLALIMGDNLGLNTILRFIKCFKNSVHFCRFCKMPNNSKTMFCDLKKSIT